MNYNRVLCHCAAAKSMPSLSLPVDGGKAKLECARRGPASGFSRLGVSVTREHRVSAGP